MCHLAGYHAAVFHPANRQAWGWLTPSCCKSVAWRVIFMRLQPRRISAVSIAERVAIERCEALGLSAGYSEALLALPPVAFKQENSYVPIIIICNHCWPNFVETPNCWESIVPSYIGFFGFSINFLTWQMNDSFIQANKIDKTFVKFWSIEVVDWVIWHGFKSILSHLFTYLMSL